MNDIILLKYLLVNDISVQYLLGIFEYLWFMVKNIENYKWLLELQLNGLPMRESI